MKPDVEKHGQGAFQPCYTYADHVLLGDSLGNSDNQRNLSLNGLHDSTSSHRGRDVDDRGVGLKILGGISNGVEDGKAQMGLATLLGRDTSNHVGTILDGLLGVESTLVISIGEQRQR